MKTIFLIMVRYVGEEYSDAIRAFTNPAIAEETLDHYRANNASGHEYYIEEIDLEEEELL